MEEIKLEEKISEEFSANASAREPKPAARSRLTVITVHNKIRSTESEILRNKIKLFLLFFIFLRVEPDYRLYCSRCERVEDVQSTLFQQQQRFL